MESAAPQTPVQALEALQNAYSRFLDALPEARRASLGEAIGFFLRSDGNPKLGSLVDAFAEELPVHVEALKTRLAACPAEEADRLATQALELMLLYPRPKDGATEFSLAAFEGFAAPLLPFLAPGRSWRSATGRSPRPGRCCLTRRNSGRPCPAAEAQAQPPPAPLARGAADMSVMSGAAP